MVERRDCLYFNPNTARRSLNGHENDILSPDTPVESVRAYLLDPKVYGPKPTFKNFRRPKLTLR